MVSCKYDNATFDTRRRKERHKNDTEGLGEMELTRRKMHEEDSEEEEEKPYAAQRSSRGTLSNHHCRQDLIFIQHISGMINTIIVICYT